MNEKIAPATKFQLRKKKISLMITEIVGSLSVAFLSDYGTIFENQNMRMNWIRSKSETIIAFLPSDKSSISAKIF